MAILEKQQIGAGVRVWKSARGQLRTERPAREVCIFRATGHLEDSFVELFEEVVLDAIKVGRPHLFWDGEAMSGYDTEFRQRIGECCVRLKPSVNAMNVFTPNRFVAMGAAVINIWVGNFFTIFRDRGAFEDCLHDMLPASSKRP